MAAIKSYTDVNQSKKLAEFLPLESADMHYHYDNDFGELESIPTITEEDDHFALFPKDFSCWSLAALLGVLPKYELNNFGNAIQLDVNRDAFETEGDETLLDLVVNAIIYLHEHKKL
jgi:hypothetical protein